MRKSGEQRREEIVQAVIHLAAEKDGGQITAQAIADRVGIAQPTVFRHFKTRDRILEAVIEWIARQLLGVVGSVAAGTGPADERLRQLLEQQLSFIAKHRGLPRLLFSERLHQENTHLKRSVGRIMEAYSNTVADLLRDGVASGVFRPDLDADETARLILAMIQGLVMRWSIHDFDFELPNESASLWRLLEPALLKR
ncbi:TetR family transcriptional regulator [Wenzhouxiangella sp. XN201]|uniref:TetR/AcrR family transcriptional regulator n=1 Tax=Wenzhouxiangella sp. XN201 TaxID=2710755 RepID=UPI0013CC8CCB|nr:TetR/AcrR family transcriptional regulator C-terminal domain-containing protein [Wenzhouxiangella sp. XN201]NEZ02706.1 TetR family transcriptional regulator [Wenzhouxiangella sp. XN201]